MTFRRIIAGLLVFLFVVVALPSFFVYSLSKTFFNGSFYTGDMNKRFYEFIVPVVSQRVYLNDKILRTYFEQEEVEKAFREAFTLDLMKKVTAEIGQSVESLKKDPLKPTTINLKYLRDSSLTAAHDLAFQLFQSIPKCKSTELPQVNEDGIPSCIPENIIYTDVAGPISKQFESSVIAAFPEQFLVDLTASSSINSKFLITIFAGIEQVKIVFLATLLLLTLLIAVFVHSPFSTLLKYESAAFGIAGIVGFLSSFSFEFIQNYLTNYSQRNIDSNVLENAGFLQQFLTGLFSFSYPMAEMQKAALVFMAVGGGLYLVQFVLKRFTKTL